MILLDFFRSYIVPFSRSWCPCGWVRAAAWARTRLSNWFPFLNVQKRLKLLTTCDLQAHIHIRLLRRIWMVVHWLLSTPSLDWAEFPEFIVQSVAEGVFVLLLGDSGESYLFDVFEFVSWWLCSGLVRGRLRLFHAHALHVGDNFFNLYRRGHPRLLLLALFNELCYVDLAKRVLIGITVGLALLVIWIWEICWPLVLVSMDESKVLLLLAWVPDA